MALNVNSPVSDFIKYVEDNNLYNSFNKMLVQCDDTLKEILGVDSFAFFGLERLLKQKKEGNLVKEKIMVSDDMSLEEIAAKILASLHTMPMNLEEKEEEEKEAEEKEAEGEKSTSPSTPSTPEYEEEAVESEYDNYDEFQVTSFNGKSVMFERFTRNGTPMIRLNGLMFEAEDLQSYVGASSPFERVDTWTEGVIVGGVTVFMIYMLFSLWLSLVNYGLLKMSS